MPTALGPLDMTPPVMLAPMAGITDLPFRALVARFGAGMVVSEMVASHAMLNARPCNWLAVKRHPWLRPPKWLQGRAPK